jgi:tetratricopeptide (TPR) repeat protein
MRRPGAAIRDLSSMLVLLACLLGTAGAAADQTDGHLDALFGQLKAAEDTEAARPLEAQIWAIWTQSGNDKVDALMMAGVAALNEADYDAALKAFSQVVAVAPGFAEGWNKRATTLYLLGRFDDSIKDIDQVLRLEPRHFGALSGLGLCNANLDKDQAALDAFERAIAIDPNLDGAKRNIEELKKRLARHSI